MRSEDEFRPDVGQKGGEGLSVYHQIRRVQGEGNGDVYSFRHEGEWQDNARLPRVE